MSRNISRALVAAAAFTVACGAKSALIVPDVVRPPDADALPDSPDSAPPLRVCSVETADIDLSPGGPRPLAPWSTTFVTSQRPTFRWVLPAGATGADIKLCRTANCDTPTQVIAAEGTSFRPPRALEPGVWFWRLRDRVHDLPGCRVGPLWEFFVRRHDAPIDTSEGITMDLDRDGFDDVASTGPDGMRFAAYWGGPGGLRTPAMIEDWFETTPISAGDVDGDGTGDLLQVAGTTMLLLGTPGGLPRRQTLDIHSPVSPAGDVDGDGYADVLVVDGRYRLTCRRGGSVPLVDSLPVTSRLGPTPVLVGGDREVVGGVDINGDGFGDAVIPASGEIRVLLGSSSRLEETVAVPMRNDSAPHVIAAGDLDGDGFGDLVSNTLDVASGLPWLYVVHGGADPGAYRASRWTPSESIVDLNHIVAGDVDGDGYVDIVLARQGAGERPHFALHTGGPSGLSTMPAIEGFLQGGEIRDMAAGDVDGDGVWEVIETNLRVDDPNAGELQIYGDGLAMPPTRIASRSWQHNPSLWAMLAR